MATERPSHATALRFAAIAATAAGLLAGCGSRSSNTTAAQSGSRHSDMVAYASCMRSNGVPGFPDPTVSASGRTEFQFSPGDGVSPESPAFITANRTCRTLLPNGGAPRKPLSAAQLREFVQYAACMRAHGVPGFPDPRFGSGTVTVALGPDVNPAAPAFQSAEGSCHSVVPAFRGFDRNSSGAVIRGGG
jgi:hypothetical protein